MKDLRLKLLFVFLSFWGLDSRAQGLIDNVSVLASTGFYSISGTVQGRNRSVSGIGAHGVFLEGTFKNHYKVFGGLSMLISQGLTGDTAMGFDLGIKYYHWSRSGPRSDQIGNISIQMQDIWRPYLGFALRNREFFSVLSSKYVGMGVLGGVDYTYSKNVFLNAEFRIDQMLGSGDASLMFMTGVIGLGLNLK